jgi:hypothetical protein
MKCINFDECGNEVEPSRLTYWEAVVLVRDRDGGGPNRRSLRKTGRGLCDRCSLRLERNMPAGQETLV